MVAVTGYGDITPAIAAWGVVRMLKRALPLLQFERFAQTFVLPTNSTQTAKFRRYFLKGTTGAAGPDAIGSDVFGMPLATTPLTEGVTPSGSMLDSADYTVTVKEYGDFITITDTVIDTHPDHILAEATDILGEQAAQTVETLRFNVLKAGTNVFYANSVADRAHVSSAITLADQRKVTSALNRQNAKKITTVIASTPAFNTTSVEAGYMAVCHPDLETNIRDMVGFTPVAKYGPHTSPFEGEIGSVEQVRYLATTIALPWINAATSGTLGTLRSTGGQYADVYPVLYFGRDAYGIVPLKGKSTMSVMVVNPKPAAGDPLGQRGTVGWKLWTAAVILQDAFLGRLEVGATA